MLPYEVLGAIILKPNEKLLQHWQGSFVDIGAIRPADEPPPLFKGYLVATNMRLIFISGEGIFTKKFIVRASAY